MYEFAVTPAVTQIRRRGVEISEVLPGTIGAELELEPGDRIMRVNGRVIRDYLDYRFHSAGETELTVDVRKHTGEDWELNIERDEAEDHHDGEGEQQQPEQREGRIIGMSADAEAEDAEDREQAAADPFSGSVHRFLLKPRR